MILEVNFSAKKMIALRNLDRFNGFKESIGDKKVKNRNNHEVPYSTLQSIDRKLEALLLIRADMIDNHVL